MHGVLTRRALNRAFLARQGLLRRESAAIAATVARICGLQAQDARPPFIALWSRLEGFRREQLSAALQDRSIVRATLMRATLHIVTADDYGAWRPLLQPVLDAAAATILKNRRLELNRRQIDRVARSLLEAGPKTFAEIRAALASAFPGIDERALGYSVRMGAPLITPPEPHDWSFGRDPKFTLAETWLGKPLQSTDRACFVRRYLAAFGPATPADAQAWSGLTGLRPTFEAMADLTRFQDERGRTLYDLPTAPRPPEDTPAPVRLLGEFDVVMLGHADRSRIVDSDHRARIATRNLRIPALVTIDGFVGGTWSLTETRTDATLTLAIFGTLAKRDRQNLEAEAEALCAFLAPMKEARRVIVADP
jgi:hypothetical protein